MSWFDTNKIASMATKAMKEAQKTLDTALDIKEEDVEESQDNIWSGWKKSQSETKLSEKSSNMSTSLWGSFSGSFIEAGSISDKSGLTLPISSSSSVVTSAPASGSLLSPINVLPDHSSVLGNDPDDEINNSIEMLADSTDEKFTESRLVVTDRDIVSPESPSVEIIGPESNIQADQSSTSDLNMLQSVELSSPQSSVEVISPSSIEIISPEMERCLEMSSPSSGSAVEVISPEPDQDTIRLKESLDSSMSLSSTKTVIEDDNNSDNNAHDEMQAQLEAAMLESEKKSETCSSKSSEIVRVDMSDTTSSDIEVLNLVNTRKSSLQSSHTRNSSDQSYVSDGPQPGDTNADSIHKLTLKNKELSEVLAARESKLMAVSREIVQLQEESGDMSVRLQASLDLLQVEKNKNHNLEQSWKVDQEQVLVLKKELNKLQQTLKSKGGDDQEKDEVIADLRSEGEALAKQNGKLSESIKKLRDKAKSHEGEVKKLKTDLEKNVSEVDRLKKSLNSKNEVEGTQCETIKSLTDANKAWEIENRQIKSDLEDNVEKVLGLRSSLEGAYREMAEMKRKLEEAAGEAAAAALSREVALRETAVAALEDERRSWNNQRQRLELQVVNIQDSLQMNETSSREREDKLRLEIVGLRLKLEESERRQEDMSDCVGKATKPLLRQIETLQTSLREVTSVQEKVEQSLGERLQLANQSLAHAQERERSLAERVQGFSTKEAASREKVSQERERRIEIETKLQHLEEKVMEIEETNMKERQDIEKERSKVREELEQLGKEREHLRASLATQESDSQSRKIQCVALMEQLKERDRRVEELQHELDSRSSVRYGRSSVTSIRSVSPTPSHVSDAAWLPEDPLYYAGNSTPASLYDSARCGSNAAWVESIGAQLKQKEGELMQMQVLLSEQNKLKESTNKELTRLTILADQNDSLKEEVEYLKKELATVQQKYDTMLTMYGEKVEEAEELKLDLQDVKDMYKIQIEQLLHSKN